MTRLLLLHAAVPTAATWPPPGHVAPHLMLGPTANQPDTIANDTVALVADSAGRASWDEVRGYVVSSGGALHIRQQVFGFMKKAGPELQKTLAVQTRQLGLQVSIEAGGSLCGAGSGAKAAQGALNNLAGFLNNGGELAFFGLESVFSRTHGGCKQQPLNDTVGQLAEYAGVIAAALPDTKLFLYDALPHYAVGADWPANKGAETYGLELGEVLTLLRPAMAARGAKLSGYWADCPYEYSSGDTPLPGGKDGFLKIAAAVKLVKGMGLQFGKTFNSQQGGQTSGAEFYKRTLDDFARTTAVVPSAATGGYSLDYVMIETWYSFPEAIIPETEQYTTTFTARAVMREVNLTTA